MKITKLSNDFAPIHKGIYFDINTEESVPTNILVEIINSSTSEIVATQQLRGVSSAKVNIAPYLPRFEEYKPMQNCCSTLSEAPCARYKVRINEIESEEIVVSVNTVEVEGEPTIITAMPQLRQISHGEYDELLIITGGNKNIYAEVTSDTGEQLHIEHYSATGASRLTLHTEDFGSDIHTLDITLFCNGELFGSLHYTMVSPLKTATRLVWLSEKGSFERYTFPVSHKVQHLVEKGAVATSEGVQATHCNTKQTYSLLSRIEPNATTACLARIISAPKVWIEYHDALESVEVVTHTIEQNLFDTPNCICIDICTLKEEEHTW